MRRALLILVAACGENDHRGAGEMVIVAASPRVDEGGATTFAVSLAAPPAQPIAISIRSADPRALQVSPATVVILPTNQPQLVTATGVRDPYVTGLRTVELALTAPGVAADSLAITVGDDDVAAAIVAPDHGLVTTEAGARAGFSIRLAAKPYDDVTLALGSTNPSEGVPARSSVTFTPSNWDLAQTIDAIGVDDDVADGPQPYEITIGPAASADLAFAAMQSLAIDAINADDDEAAIVAAPTGGLVTTEAGATASFTLVLGSRPVAEVEVPIATDAADEVALSTDRVVFAPAEWNVPHVVTIRGLDDSIVDGDRDVSIDLGPATSSDPAYAGTPGGHVHATNLDDDTPGIDAAPTALVTSEAGLADHFTVALHSQPTAPVAVSIASTNAGEGTVDPALLVFTQDDWDQPQTVTVQGVDDRVSDGDVAYQITLAASSADPVYAGLTADPVTATNLGTGDTIPP